MMTGRQGNCGCATVLLAVLLLPVITSFPLLGFFILLFLLAGRK